MALSESEGGKEGGGRLENVNLVQSLALLPACHYHEVRRQRRGRLCTKC